MRKPEVQKDAVRNSHPQKGDVNGKEERHEEAEQGWKRKIGPTTALTVFRAGGGGERKRAKVPGSRHRP